MVKDFKNERGEAECREWKTEEGKTNLLSAKTCYIRSDHEADTLIHNILFFN